jgi:hypothetical protein
MLTDACTHMLCGRLATPIVENDTEILPAAA